MNWQRQKMKAMMESLFDSRAAFAALVFFFSWFLPGRLATFGFNQHGATAAFVAMVFGSVSRAFTVLSTNLSDLSQSAITFIFVSQQMSSEKANAASINTSSHMTRGKSSRFNDCWITLCRQLHSPKADCDIRGNNRATAGVFLATSAIVRSFNAHNVNNNTAWMARHGGGILRKSNG